MRRQPTGPCCTSHCQGLTLRVHVSCSFGCFYVFCSHVPGACRGQKKALGFLDSDTVFGHHMGDRSGLLWEQILLAAEPSGCLGVKTAWAGSDFLIHLTASQVLGLQEDAITPGSVWYRESNPGLCAFPDTLHHQSNISFLCSP